jgi:hypothetical protein
MRQRRSVIRLLEDRRVLVWGGRQAFADRVEGKRYGGDRNGIELTIGAGADPGG